MAASQLTAGVDLGGTKIQTVVLRGGRVAGQARVPTPQTGRAADVIGAIVGSVQTSIRAAGRPAKLRGIGIGTPGDIDQTAGVVSLAANVPGFTDRVALGPEVSAAFEGVEVVIDNDVRVAVLGEHERGAGKPFRNMLGVWVGTGVGGGIVIDGELHDGRGAAGEIGHLVVRPGGRSCSCGRRGHLEAYAGRGRMEARAKRLVKRGAKTVLFDLMAKRGRDRLSSGIYALALEHGDKMTKSLLADATWALGVALASAQNLLDLEAIVLGGGLGDRLGRPFIDAVEVEMTRHLFTVRQPPALLPTAMGDLSGAVGAAVLAGG